MAAKRTWSMPLVSHWQNLPGFRGAPGRFVVECQGFRRYSTRVGAKQPRLARIATVGPNGQPCGMWAGDVIIPAGRPTGLDQQDGYGQRGNYSELRYHAYGGSATVLVRRRPTSNSPGSGTRPASDCISTGQAGMTPGCGGGCSPTLSCRGRGIRRR